MRDYLHRRLRGILDDVIEYAVKAPRSRYFDIGSPCAHGVEGCPWPFRYGGRGGGQDYIGHLASMGLGYVRRILKTEDDERTDLMLHGSDTCCDSFSAPEFLSQALGLWYNGSDMIETYMGDRGNWTWAMMGVNNALRTSSGWKWYSTHCLPNERFNKSLRDWGVVFWDRERLRDAGVLARKPSELVATRFKNHSRHEVSVQERLMGPEREIVKKREMMREAREMEDGLDDEVNETEKEQEERT